MARWAKLRFALFWVYWFSLFLCVGLVAGLSDVGCRIVGLLWKGVSAAFGKDLDQARQKPPHKPHNPAPAQKKYIRGEFNTSMVLGALREKGMGLSVGGCLKTKHGL